MPELFSSGRIIDLILLAVVAETIALALLHRFAAIGPGLLRVAPNLIAGACLMLALRTALTNAAWSWTALWLTLALVAHAADLGLRWRS